MKKQTAIIFMLLCTLFSNANDLANKTETRFNFTKANANYLSAGNASVKYNMSTMSTKTKKKRTFQEDLDHDFKLTLALGTIFISSSIALITATGVIARKPNVNNRTKKIIGLAVPASVLSAVTIAVPLLYIKDSKLEKKRKKINAALKK